MYHQGATYGYAQTRRPRHVRIGNFTNRDIRRFPDRFINYNVAHLGLGDVTYIIFMPATPRELRKMPEAALVLLHDDLAYEVSAEMRMGNYIFNQGVLDAAWWTIMSIQGVLEKKGVPSFDVREEWGAGGRGGRRGARGEDFGGRGAETHTGRQDPHDFNSFKTFRSAEERSHGPRSEFTFEAPEPEAEAEEDEDEEEKATPDLYAVLGVPRNATIAVIQKAFKIKIIGCHPDKVGKDDATQKQAQKDTAKLNLAREILTNEEKRKRYDDTGRVDEPKDEEKYGGQGWERGGRRGWGGHHGSGGARQFGYDW